MTPMTHTDGVNNLAYDYYYDAIGRLYAQQISDNNGNYIGATQFTYDLRNNVTKISNNMGGKAVTQLYGYSAISSRPETVNYAKDNLATRYTMSSTRYIDYTYDGLNRLTGKTLSLATPLVTRYSYKQSDRTDATYRTTMIANEIIGTTAYGYLYDDLGNITAVLKAEADGNGNKTGSYSYIRTYEYDSLNQLIRENNKTDNKTYVYEYDGYGNITAKKVYAYTTSATLGTAEKTISYAYGVDSDAGWKNILKIYNGENIDYDEIGNPISYRGATLDWDTRELKSYSKNGTNITYKYDADGLRSSKTVNGVTTNYQYVSGKLMYEECNGAEKYYFYDSNGIISGIRYFDANGNMTMIYVVTNAQGDVIALYDKNGNAVVEYQYDAWGNIISVVNSTEGSSLDWNEINPFRYRGYYFDSETGLYYLQSRYYDAETGRFINADGLVSTGQGLLGCNMFAYCGNNPVARKDATGAFWNTIIGTISGAIIGGVSAAISGGDVGAGIVGGALSGFVTGGIIDITIATGGTGLMAFATVVAVSGVGSFGGSVVSQSMDTGEVDLGTALIDGIWGAVGGAISYGTAGIGTSACQTIKQIVSQPIVKIFTQGISDLSMDLVTSAGTWLCASAMNYPRTVTSSKSSIVTQNSVSCEYELPQYRYKYGRLK